MAKRPPIIRMRPLILKQFPGPLHRQVYLALREQILNGDLKRGARLMSSRGLARVLQTSRNTVLTAYDKLADEAYIIAKIGSGTRVSMTFADQSDAHTRTGTKHNHTIAGIFEQSHYPLRHAIFQDCDRNSLYLYDPHRFPQN